MIFLEYAENGDLQNIINYYTLNKNFNIPSDFEDKRYGYTGYIFDRAAMFGHLNIIKWLDQNTQEQCTSYAFDMAAKNGHIEVVKWLHENTKEGSVLGAMGAASSGHLDIVIFV